MYPILGSATGSRPNAVTFNGSSYLYNANTNPLYSINEANSAVSFWWNTSTNQNAYILTMGGGTAGNNPYFYISNNGGRDIGIVGYNSSRSLILNVNTNTNVLPADGKWHWVACSWVCGTPGDSQIFIDGTSQTLATNTSVAGTINYSFTGGTQTPNYGVSLGGGVSNGSSAFPIAASIGEFWFDPTNWIDFSLSARRNYFYNSTTGRPNRPTTAGAPGITGSPWYYFKGPTSTWGTNYGAGPNVTTVSGSAPTTASDLPIWQGH